MMNRKSIIGAVVGLLLLSGLIGANLVMAGAQTPQTGTKQATTTDDDNLECPDQGLPACSGQMNDDKSEGPENEAEGAEDQNEGAENQNEGAGG